MPLNARLVEVFVQFAQHATGDFQVADILHQLAAASADILDIAGAGVVFNVGDRMQLVSATSPAVQSAEQIQDAMMRGPCMDARASGRVVIEEDLAAHPQRWPQFCEHAQSLSLRSVASIPLLARGHVWGALDVYRASAGSFDETFLRTAQALADVAVAYVVMAHDRDQARAAHQVAAHSATHDPLTGLGNRALLFAQLEQAITAASGSGIGVLFIDLDNFKSVNDQHGHLVGDQLLIEVARRVAGALRPTDILARYAGDEFVALCPDLPTPATLAQLQQQVQQALAAPLTLNDTELDVSASIGAAVLDPTMNSADNLLRAADQAMYEAKRRGRP
ncbi:sensor domain-containing diguanylate cyclase [Cellulomonas endophytica]|uniref:sensor domain-containing diguanylate cyclase n=1 Tax=Cellulomonas endophytica TaxID=2494735 RepID=UPI0013E97908|nr:sensor domain-containing diguanylate cyclase [Cellulomonas endophytica]